MEKRKVMIREKNREEASILENVGNEAILTDEDVKEYIRKQGFIPLDEAMRNFYNIADNAASKHEKR